MGGFSFFLSLATSYRHDLFALSPCFTWKIRFRRERDIYFFHNSLGRRARAPPPPRASLSRGHNNFSFSLSSSSSFFYFISSIEKKRLGRLFFPLFFLLLLFSSCMDDEKAHFCPDFCSCWQKKKERERLWPCVVYTSMCVFYKQISVSGRAQGGKTQQRYLSASVAPHRSRSKNVRPAANTLLGK